MEVWWKYEVPFSIGLFFWLLFKKKLLGTDTNIPHKNGKKTGKGKIIDSNIPWRYSLVPICATSICWSFFCFKTTPKNLIYKVSGQLEIPQGAVGDSPVDGLMGGYCTTRPVEISITQMQVVGTNDAGSDRVKGGGIEMCFVLVNLKTCQFVVASKIRGIDGLCFWVFKVLLCVVAWLQPSQALTYIENG